jgi:hypothetical protein
LPQRYRTAPDEKNNCPRREPTVLLTLCKEDPEAQSAHEQPFHAPLTLTEKTRNPHLSLRPLPPKICSPRSPFRIRASATLDGPENAMVAIPKDSTSYIFLVLAVDRPKVRSVAIFVLV